MKEFANQLNAKILSYLDAATSIFNARPMTEEGKRIWIAILSRYQFEQIDYAFQKYMSESSFMPKPADIVKIIDGNPTDKATLAWNKVLCAIRDIGEYQSICFDDPIIHVVLQEMGGWSKICRITDDKVPFVAQDFSKRYQTKAAVGVERLEGVPRALSGYFAVTNKSGGIEAQEEVVLYGDEDMAELVFKMGAGDGVARLTHRRGDLGHLSIGMSS